MKAEYDFIVTVETDLLVEDAAKILAAIVRPGVKIVSVQWVP